MLRDRVSDKLLERVTWRNLSRIQEIAQWSDSEMAERLNLTSREFLKNRALNRPVLVAPLVALAESLEVSADSLLFGKLDYVALEKQLHGDWDYIPEKYTVAARSSRDMVRNLLSYNTRKYGIASSMRLLRPFQIKYSAILNGDSPINLRLSTEIAKVLSESEHANAAGIDIGRNAALYFENSTFQKHLLELKPKNMRDAFVGLCELAPVYLEKNILWSVERTQPSSFSFIGRPNWDVLQSTGEELARLPVASGVRLGFSYALPELAKLSGQLFEIHVRRCLSWGDPEIEYEVHWTTIKSKIKIPVIS